METDKTKVSMKIELPAFRAELEAYVDEGSIEKKMSGFLDAFESTKKRIEKTFGNIPLNSKIVEEIAPAKRDHPLENLSEPFLNISKRINVVPEKLIGSSVFGFKSGKPQLFDQSKFKSANTATRALIYLYEVGLGKENVSLNEIQEAYSLSKIKGRAVSQIVQDLAKTSQIDAGSYKKTKSVILTAKGLKEAENELKYVMGDSNS